MFINNKAPKSPKTILSGGDQTVDNSTGAHQEIGLTGGSIEKNVGNQPLSSLPEGAVKSPEHDDGDGMCYN